MLCVWAQPHLDKLSLNIDPQMLYTICVRRHVPQFFFFFDPKINKYFLVGQVRRAVFPAVKSHWECAY